MASESQRARTKSLFDSAFNVNPLSRPVSPFSGKGEVEIEEGFVLNHQQKQRFKFIGK